VLIDHRKSAVMPGVLSPLDKGRQHSSSDGQSPKPTLEKSDLTVCEGLVQESRPRHAVNHGVPIGQQLHGLELFILHQRALVHQVIQQRLRKTAEREKLAQRNFGQIPGTSQVSTEHVTDVHFPSSHIIAP
jgi:hypothetical protein